MMLNWLRSVFSVALVLSCVRIRAGPVCLLSLTLYNSSEWLTDPEVYLACDNGDFLNLPLVDVTYRQHYFDPPLCLNGDLSDDESLSCQIKEQDVFYDDEIGYFSVKGSEFSDKDVVGRQEENFSIQLIRKDDIHRLAPT